MTAQESAEELVRFLDEPLLVFSRPLPYEAIASYASGMCRSILISVAIALATFACEQQAPTPVPATRSESDQQVLKLREDNEVEFQDLRGRWLAAEAQLLQLKKSLDSTNSAALSERTALRESLQLLETEMMSIRAAIGGVSGGIVASTVTIPERERLRRSAEEIICLRRRGADEQVAEVYSRYGFADEREWSAAWLRHASNAGFEAELFARLKSLCPRYREG